MGISHVVGVTTHEKFLLFTGLGLEPAMNLFGVQVGKMLELLRVADCSSQMSPHRVCFGVVSALGSLFHSLIT